MVLPRFSGFLLLVFSIMTTVSAWAEPYAKFEDGRLILGNALIERAFALDSDGVRPLRLTDRGSGMDYPAPTREPNAVSKSDDAPAGSEWTQEKVPASNLEPAHLRVEVESRYPDYRLKHVFRIVRGVPAIQQTQFVRIEPEADPQRLKQLDEAGLVLDEVGLSGKHWKARSVEFFDRTDERNTLTSEYERIAFTKEEQMRGNLLWATRLNEENGIFLLKEAPSSESQLHYPGHDFRFSREGLSVDGPGLLLSELEPGQWYRAYGVVVGVFDGGFDGMRMALRDYQKTVRVYDPERDAMLMMNTWGDRNRDARINDDFLRREVDAAAELGLSHFQIDDGWQQGLSQNSAQQAGEKWAAWEREDWVPHAERLADGFAPIVRYAKKKQIELGLWFNPTRANDYATWERDADIVLDLYRKHGFRYIKIDGMELPTKTADERFRRFCEKIMRESNGEIVLHLDATAGQRMGYHYLNRYGVVFLENRYTDWGSYYPHWTLRNLWMLSHYVPPERLQIEFLNKWRRTDQYDTEDPLAPINVPFDYIFASTMMAQPLAWFEASGLPEEGMAIAPIVKQYRELMPEIHRGAIFPIGNEPDGHQWTGFQSMLDARSGFLLVLRENTVDEAAKLRTLFPPEQEVQLIPVLPEGAASAQTVGKDGSIEMELPRPFSYQLFRYKLANPSADQ